LDLLGQYIDISFPWCKFILTDLGDIFLGPRRKAMQPFQIKGFPMPPSANALYKNKNGDVGGGREKSQAYRAYEEECVLWSYKNGYQLQNIRIAISQLPKNTVFHVERTFYFRAHRTISKAGNPLKNETLGRPKALDDCLAKLIGIDDKLFWDDSNKKRPSLHVALGEYVDIVLTPMGMPVAPEEVD